RQVRIVQTDDLNRRQESGGDAAIGQCGAQGVQIAWTWIRHRLQQRRIDGAENGSSRTYSDGKRDNCGHRKRWCARQRVQRKTEVLQKCAHRFFEKYTLRVDAQHEQPNLIDLGVDVSIQSLIQAEEPVRDPDAMTGTPESTWPIMQCQRRPLPLRRG